MRKSIHFYFLLLSTVVLVSSCAPPINQQRDLELLASIENAFVNVVARSKPAIVGIFVEGMGEAHSQNRVGSGFIFRKEGYILTNHHVVHDAIYIAVKLLNGRRFEAELVGTDQNTDVAVLKIERDEAFPVIPLADSSKVRVGQFAIAIGNPFGLDYTVTTGVVSGKSRSILRGFSIIRYQDFIQTDAWINTGSSGGPLLNIRGEVIGINALIRRIENENTPAPAMAGAGFAIPINLVKTVGDQLIASGRVIRGYLGVQMREVKEGIRVRPVGGDTPAYLGGLRRNDIIFEYNGKKVKKTVDLQMLVAESQVGERSIIRVLRHGHERILNVTIGEMPPHLAGQVVEIKSVAWEILGLSVRKLEARDFERYMYLTDEDRGVIVEQVKEQAPGFKAKIPNGALITAMNDQKITDVRNFEALLQTNQDAKELILNIKSSHGTERITVNLEN
ncbi:MAG: trypsin-like peptidase domain-containing protein [Candidatus Poribacteria bacterium]|nr:trypsin-like peptidase domain-containing protein [Candidatus Poribacteria bacterium]